jgi:hypothetical protein
MIPKKYPKSVGQILKKKLKVYLAQRQVFLNLIYSYMAL